MALLGGVEKHVLFFRLIYGFPCGDVLREPRRSLANAVVNAQKYRRTTFPQNRVAGFQPSRLHRVRP